MKRVLGLDLGTTSIGWAFVKEAESINEKSGIVRLGVRVNPLTTDEKSNFEEGKSITTNADRTLKRHARRNLDRYQLRRDNLKSKLVEEGWITDASKLHEGERSELHETYALRAKAVNEKISLEDFARILMMINKKRGYKSSRKATNEDESGELIDEMDIALMLQRKGMTPGQYAYQLLESGKKKLPTFYGSDLEQEFDRIWQVNKDSFSEVLTDDFYEQIKGKTKTVTTKTFLAKFQIYTAKNEGKNKRLQAYKWRAAAADEVQEDIGVLAFILAEVNGNISNSSGYLGAISDRSKILITQELTVGQYQYKQLQESKHNSLRNQIFYRRDYMDEFEVLWSTQSKFHKLSDDLRKEIKDRIIFYQRPLRSQKGLISFCEFESREVVIKSDGKKRKKTIGSRVAPRSSPLFQEFKIWQQLANVETKNTQGEVYLLSNEEKVVVAEALATTGGLSGAEVLDLLYREDADNYEINHSKLDGDKTSSALIEAYCKMIELAGFDEKISKKGAQEQIATIRAFFREKGIVLEVLDFDSSLTGHELVRQPAYQLWHLLYSYEGDSTRSGVDRLYQVLKEKFGFDRDYATFLVNVSLIQDYGQLSAKAIKRILPFLKKHTYSDACEKAGYNHSSSLTKEENEQRVLLEKLEVIPKNGLRNPVVEKILNQMIHVVNAIIEHPDMGRPDEIRVELARELKQNAKERERTTKAIAEATKNHERIVEILRSEFRLKNPTRNDIIKYKLYEELAHNGYHTLYTNTYVKPQELYSKNIDIEHIIPKALSFDDSFSNKTLAIRKVNADKDKMTAIDFVTGTMSDENVQAYKERVKAAYDGNHINKAKYEKLLRPQIELKNGFIQRDLRETQYIAKKAAQILTGITRQVVATSGKITDRLRDDWNLINVMKELNLPKYEALGLTYKEERKDNRFVTKIKDWTKRNDHRHHAMDALAIAFTTRSHIQYLNNLNAKSIKGGSISGIEKKITAVDAKGKRRFVAPVMNFREQAKKHLDVVLISRKAKNKVVTRNLNKTKAKGLANKQETLTPRGQLHKETIYGKIQQYKTKPETVNAKFDRDKISTVAKKELRDALYARLAEHDDNPKMAFTGKNSIAKKPLLLVTGKEWTQKVETLQMEEVYTIRKDVSPELNIGKVIDQGVKRALQKRLDEHGGNAKKAFVDLDENPIWLNKEEGISIKRVKITGVTTAEALHEKREMAGKQILDAKGNYVQSSFVSTGNNHHVALYKDEKGKLQEKVVSLFEAVARVNMGLPIIDKHYNADIGWEYQFNMKQNEYFVFPTSGFDPSEIDLQDSKNYQAVSCNLFRVQKFSPKDYTFRHHLESTLDMNCRNVTYIRFRKPEDLIKIRKVRLNHLGEVVHVGDY